MLDNPTFISGLGNEVMIRWDFCGFTRNTLIECIEDLFYVLSKLSGDVFVDNYGNYDSYGGKTVGLDNIVEKNSALNSITILFDCYYEPGCFLYYTTKNNEEVLFRRSETVVITALTTNVDYFSTFLQE